MGCYSLIEQCLYSSEVLRGLGVLIVVVCDLDAVGSGFHDVNFRHYVPHISQRCM